MIKICATLVISKMFGKILSYNQEIKNMQIDIPYYFCIFGCISAYICLWAKSMEISS